MQRWDGGVELVGGYEEPVRRNLLLGVDQVSFQRRFSRFSLGGTWKGIN